MSDGQEMIFVLSVIMGLAGLFHFAFGWIEKAQQRRREEERSRDRIEEIQSQIRTLREEIIRNSGGR